MSVKKIKKNPELIGQNKSCPNRALDEDNILWEMYAEIHGKSCNC